MVVVVLALLVCLVVSAAVALFVAFPGRGRPLPAALRSVRGTARHVRG